MNANVNDPVARGFRTIYSAEVTLDNPAFVRNVTFGFQNYPKHITFSIGSLPLPQGTEVWLLGFSSEEGDECISHSGIAFASKQDVISFVRNGYEGARTDLERIILHRLEASGREIEYSYSLRDVAALLLKRGNRTFEGYRSEYETSQFIFDVVRLP